MSVGRTFGRFGAGVGVDKEFDGFDEFQRSVAYVQTLNSEARIRWRRR